MRLSVASVILAAAFGLTTVAAGTARSQDFSITNTVAPVDAGRRDVMRQLQAWWDVHAYYPRHASQNDEVGTVKLHLLIHPDGNIWMVDVTESAGSRALDTAGAAVFRGGFVRPLPAGTPDTIIDVSLHYVLAHRHDQPVVADDVPVRSKSAFTITNDPDRSTVVNTMLRRTCTGTVVKGGLRNHPIYGSRYAATAIFFRTPDGTPWVKFTSDGGFLILAPVTEIGKVAQWTGRPEHLGRGEISYTHYTVWPDGDNRLNGDITNPQGTVDLTCAAEIVPAVAWSALFVTPGQKPPGDPP